jgi:hypothetical protein
MSGLRARRSARRPAGGLATRGERAGAVALWCLTRWRVARVARCGQSRVASSMAGTGSTRTPCQKAMRSFTSRAASLGVG